MKRSASFDTADIMKQTREGSHARTYMRQAPYIRYPDGYHNNRYLEGMGDHFRCGAEIQATTARNLSGLTMLESDDAENYDTGQIDATGHLVLQNLQ
jgi:hypothetical protein